jgi:aspartate-semialdehyde dehydrogenase
MVSKYGEQSRASLSSVQQRILKLYQRIVHGQVPSPSLVVVQAPVFHGYAFSVNVQFEGRADLEHISALLGGEHIALVHAPDEAP